MTLGHRVSALLDAAGVAHALIGATALAAAGVVRSTFDVDFLTTDDRSLDPHLWQSLRAGDAAVEIRRGDADDPLAGVVRVSASEQRPVDLIVGRYGWQQRAVERAQPLSTGYRVALPRDLILLKLFAGGAQDRWDVQQLLVAVADPSLLRDVEMDLQELPAGARELWAEIRSRHEETR